MMVHYYAGMVVQKINSGDREARRSSLQLSQEYLDEFLRLVRSYEIFTERPSKTAVDRQIKIDRFREVKRLQSLVDEVAPHLLTRTIDDERVREHHLNQLRLAGLQTLGELEMIRAELEVISMDSTDILPPKHQQQKNVRKVTQPFTLLKTRDQVKAGVFRPGHNLPTMTVDEYLRLEMERGGIISQQNQQDKPVPDEDREDEAERQRIIAMDAYKDEHRRGSGNTWNRG